MTPWELALLLGAACTGCAPARLAAPRLETGGLLMMLGTTFVAAVAALFVAGLLQLPVLLPVDTANGDLAFGWALLGALGTGAAIALGIRRHRGDDGTPRPQRVTIHD